MRYLRPRRARVHRPQHAIAQIQRISPHMARSHPLNVRSNHCRIIHDSHLLARRHEVAIVDDLSTGKGDNVPKGTLFYE